jgi:Uncharacterised nucleotidyltransferase
MIRRLSMDSAQRLLAQSIFFTVAGPNLVRDVAAVLASEHIPIMPLKGVLLQAIVYKTSFRPMADVDLLVPPDSFERARSALRRAGFEVLGIGRDIFRRPGSILEVDLHRNLSMPSRSRLSAEDMFLRGRSDVDLFGVPVVVPDARDLYAHLLLHLTLDWLIRGGLHHPQDFEAVPDALGLSVSSVAEHLRTVGLEPHAYLMLPLLEPLNPGGFTGRLREALSLSGALRARAELVSRLCAHSRAGSWARRAAGALLAPSLTKAIPEAILRRVLDRQRSAP